MFTTINTPSEPQTWHGRWWASKAQLNDESLPNSKPDTAATWWTNASAAAIYRWAVRSLQLNSTESHSRNWPCRKSYLTAIKLAPVCSKCPTAVPKYRFQEERANLMEVRDPFDGLVEKAMRASTTCLIMADHNRYSVDARAVAQIMPVRPYAECIVVLLAKEVVYDPRHYLPVLMRKPGTLRNCAPFKDWNLPAGLAQVRAKLKSNEDGNVSSSRYGAPGSSEDNRRYFFVSYVPIFSCNQPPVLRLTASIVMRHSPIWRGRRIRRYVANDIFRYDTI